MSVRTRILCSTALIAGSLGLVSTLAPAIALAQTAPSAAATTGAAPVATLTEVVVTAEHRVGNVQKTSAAITVRRGDDLLKEGRFTLGSILEDVPGLTGGAATGTAGTVAGAGTDNPAAGLVIRGIPSNVGAGGSTTSTAPAAAIYVDGIYSGIGGGYDIDRVEVLRGPQGTLYGRSATAGLVAINTRNPNLNSFGGDATLETGNFNLQHYSAAVNVPIITDQLAVRLAGNLYQRDGFINGADGDSHSNDARIKVLYKPNDTVSLLVGAALENNTAHNGGQVIGTSKAVTYIDVPVGLINNNFRQYWAELNVNLGFATLTYQPAYRTWNQAGVLYGDTPIGVLHQPITTPKDNFLTQEVRLASNPDSKLIWQVGATYYKNDLNSTNESDFGPTEEMAFNVNEDKHTEAYGGFGQATYPVTDDTRVTAGVRYDHTQVVSSAILTDGPFVPGPPGPPAPIPPPFVLSGSAGTRTFNNFTYKLRLEHDLSSANLLYASVSTGFSPGDVVVVSTCPASVYPTSPCPLDLHAETLTSYELGSKNRFLGNTLQVNGDVFYSSYGAFQTGGINVALAGPPSFAPLSSPMTSYGVELETHYKVTPVDTVDFNFSWINSTYVNKPALFAQWVAENQVSNTSQAGGAAPIPVSASLAYQHIFTLPGDSKLSLRGEALYSSGHGGQYNAADAAAGLASNVNINSAVIGNLFATWMPNERVSISAYVRNLANLQYSTLITLDTSSGSPAYQPQLNDPRTFGVVLNVNF
jgi:iron complex outermembrane receptor protein